MLALLEIHAVGVSKYVISNTTKSAGFALVKELRRKKISKDVVRGHNP
jgi:hypothetical protein